MCEDGLDYPVTINATALTIDKKPSFGRVLCINLPDGGAVFYREDDPERIDRDLAKQLNDG
jgi:hypothetical protein